MRGAVDYILFLTADVTVEPNLNEIRDHKYVDKAELQAMFDNPGMSLEVASTPHLSEHLYSPYIHPLVQTHS